ncbi:hypothetical protein TRFO_16512 [Tritrichomonas foetus]|uniref:Uncharacterized protein n=1 Tax=Tritrichomonas foetus TaxID=1144522 RepID=A0A1J4KU78_9EUKA|nr:hypothetical protein TRFO_16512 [Tritrichomonas foetus]|eukprot:OHT13316.1 hypothetical protein TRFO_16512 [Tritrichomonas foetus]
MKAHSFTLPNTSKKKPKPQNISPFQHQMILDTPGPGYYDLPLGTFPSGVAHEIQNRIPVSNRTAATDIDYPEDIDFDRRASSSFTCTIGNRKETKFYDLPKTPGPMAPLSETLPPTPIKIGNRYRHEDPQSTIPGPGAYNNEAYKERLIGGVNMKTSKAPRDSIWQPVSDVPGPGSYDPTPPTDPPKRWASRLRNVRPIPVTQLKRVANKGKERKSANLPRLKKIIL